MKVKFFFFHFLYFFLKVCIFTFPCQQTFRESESSGWWKRMRKGLPSSVSSSAFSKVISLTRAMQCSLTQPRQQQIFWPHPWQHLGPVIVSITSCCSKKDKFKSNEEGLEANLPSPAMDRNFKSFWPQLSALKRVGEAGNGQNECLPWTVSWLFRSPENCWSRGIMRLLTNLR